MNACTIFNQIHDLWSYLSAYNDTIDPRREWTLCGRLSEIEKTLLRELIRDVIPSSEAYILELIDGTRIYDHTTPVTRMTFACHQYFDVYEEPWFHHTKAEEFTYPVPRLHVCDIADDHVADYIVDINGVKNSRKVGTRIHPLVAQIIIAENPKVDILWDRNSETTRSLFCGCAAIAEEKIRGSCAWTIDESMRIINGIANVVWGSGRYTLDTIRGYFDAINPLIHTRVIWKVYGVGLMRRVDDTMSNLIRMISSSRMAPRDWMAHFDTFPGDDFSDVTIIIRD